MNALRTEYQQPKILLIICMCFALTACSTTPSQDTDGYNDIGAVYDPLEEYNRKAFAVNDALDKALAEPIARGYRAVVPKPARNSLSNFLQNLRSPVNAANQLLQGDIEGMATDIARAVVNSIAGIGGLFDVAEYIGLEYEREDFGQTLAVWGVGHGPYIIVPLFGPSSLRDGTGILVDSYADPLRLYLHNTDQDEWYYARFAATAVTKREALLDVLDDLEKSSFDYYAALRSSYMQWREALVNDQDPDMTAGPAIPDYDDDE